MNSKGSTGDTMERQGTHVGKMEKLLKEWGVRLDELVSRVDKAGAGAQADYRLGVDDLKAKLQVAKTRIDELKTANIDKWQTFKSGIDIAWKDLETTFSKLKQ